MAGRYGLQITTLALGALGLLLSATSATPAGATEPGAPNAAAGWQQRAGDEAIGGLYAAWARRHEARGGDRAVELALTAPGLVAERGTRAQGQATLDLLQGRVTLRLEFEEAKGLEGLDADTLSVWWVENTPGGTLLADAADRSVHLGDIALTSSSHSDGHGGATIRWTAPLDAELLEEHRLDLLVITRQGRAAHEQPLLMARTALFQRVYSDARWLRTHTPAQRAASTHAAPMSPRGMVGMVAEGRRLFRDETFEGNGRTCNSCHRAEEGHVLSRRTARELPKSDPVRWAPAHQSQGEGGDAVAALDPTLLRLGLFRSHLGSLDSSPVVRAVRSVGGRTRQMQRMLEAPQVRTADAADDAGGLQHASGWDGAGAPHTDALLDYTASAVAEFLSRTDARVPGKDFRVPAADEIDALAAYQLWVGLDEQARGIELDPAPRAQDRVSGDAPKLALR